MWFSVSDVDDSSAVQRVRPASGAGGAPMGPGSSLGRSSEGGAAVRRLAPHRIRTCARPTCREPAEATLSFSYAERSAELTPLLDPRPAQTYDLCTAHAARTQPPNGWQLRDRRPEDLRPRDARPSVPGDLGGDRTVAVLAAALRAVSGAVSEDATTSPAAEVTPITPEPAVPLRVPADAGSEPGPRPVPAARAAAGLRNTSV